MIKIALTGNIASGKSTVQNYLKNKGFNVIDTDEIAKNLRSLKQSDIINLFKDFDITDNFGKISTQKLANLVFNNPENLKKLSKFMHPLIRKEIFKEFEKEKNIIFVGIPLLFEAQMEKDYDKIIMVYTNDDIRLKRLIERNNLSIKEAELRIKNQLPQDEKIKNCDFIIYNNSTKSNLYKQIDEILSKLKQEQTL